MFECSQCHATSKSSKCGYLTLKGRFHLIKGDEVWVCGPIIEIKTNKRHGKKKQG